MQVYQFQGGSHNLSQSVKGSCNSIHSEEVCSKITPLFLLRQEAMVHYLTEEPIFMYCKENELSEEKTLEQVLRCRVWTADSMISWSFFSEYRNFLDESGKESPLVIRKVYWNKNQEYYLNLPPNVRADLMTKWPDALIQNVYVYAEDALELIRMLMKLDSIILKLKVPGGRGTEVVSTKLETEVRRLFDWGLYHLSWNETRINPSVEGYFEELFRYVEGFISRYQKSIHTINLDYTIPPKIFKSIVEGNH